MSYSIRHTETQEDWVKWDEFVNESKRGIYLQTENWLKGYASYGFSSSLILAESDDGELLGGMGVVLASTGPFKVLVCPFGPIVKSGQEGLLEPMVSRFKEVAIGYNAFLSQTSFPFSSSENWDSYFPHIETVDKSLDEDGVGMLFKFVTGIDGVRAVNLYPKESDSLQKVLANYKSSCRRNVRKSESFGHELFFAQKDDDVRRAYSVIESNAESQGYSVRAWSDFGPTILQMVQKGQCHVPCCLHEGQMKGALLVFDVGKKLHYIMGGTVREEVDHKIGHFLHHSIIQFGIEKGYEFYDISMGGSPGVVRFKEGFGGEVVNLGDTRYWVHRNGLYWAYQKLMPWVQRNKKLMSKLLSKK